MADRLASVRASQAPAAPAETKMNAAAGVGQTAGPAGELWTILQGSSHLLLRHISLGLSIELPISGKGVLFAAADGVVKRCWADGTVYERYAFQSGDVLVKAPPTQAVLIAQAAGVMDGVQ